MDELGGYNMLRIILIILLLITIKTVECCFEHERVALLQLKSSFHSSPPRPRSTFYSWGITSDDNCCEWEGVECSYSTGRITYLLVQGDSVTEWKINASLFFPFQQLTTLYLGYFIIGDSVHNQSFDRLSTLENLESLDLSGNTFKDNSILSSIGRISSLKSLSLSYIQVDLTTDDIQGFDMMLSRLEKLESLDLSDNPNLDKSILSSISNISSLKSLYLSYFGLDSSTDIQGLSKLVNLEDLDLSGNYFNNNNTSGQLSFVSGFSTLKTLDLSDCGLKGTIDLQELDVLENLETLRLSGNQITKVVASRDIEDRVRTNLSALFLDYITPENGNGSSSNVELHSLGTYPNLKTISLCGNNFEGPLFIQEEGNYFNNLEELFFNDSYLDDKSFESIKFEGMSSLKRLSFSIDLYSDASRPKKKLPSLSKMLKLSGYV